MPLNEGVRPTKTNYSDVVEKNLKKNKETLPSEQTITAEDIEAFGKIASSRIENGKDEKLISKLKNTYTVKDIYILMIIYPQQRFRNSSDIIQNFENNKISTELLKNIIKASAIFIKPAQNLCDFYKRMIENINQKFNNEEIARKIRNCLNSTEPKNDKDQEVPELLKTILECTHTKYNEIYTKYNEIYTNKDTNMENFDENQGKEDAEGLKQLLSYIRYKELNNIEIITEIYIQLVDIMQQIGKMVDIIKREKLGEELKRP